MVLLVAEVGDEIFANLAGGIFAGVGVEALPVAQGSQRVPRHFDVLIALTARSHGARRITTNQPTLS
ncbi:MAG: hypothetical protein WAM04_12415 [Candidatus Sulfotelmatobacter sp.]